MRRVAIMAIASLNEPEYLHYIANYWTQLIRHTNAHTPDIDVYLLVENGTAPAPFAHIAANVIEDPLTDPSRLLAPRWQTLTLPGVLSKTIHALDVLAGRYDLFFRTNVSTMVMLPAFERFVRSRAEFCYSGAWVWTDALRSDLVHHGHVGPDRSVRDLSELDDYPGNTFVSGASMFLTAAEAQHLVDRRDELRYDIVEDVSIGLMMERHEVLEGFTDNIEADVPIAEALDRIRTTAAPHVRLDHFPVERAAALWRYVSGDHPWRDHRAAAATWAATHP